MRPKTIDNSRNITVISAALNNRNVMGLCGIINAPTRIVALPKIPHAGTK